MKHRFPCCQSSVRSLLVQAFTSRGTWIFFFLSPGGRGVCHHSINIILIDPRLLSSTSTHMTATSCPPSDWFASFSGCSFALSRGRHRPELGMVIHKDALSLPCFLLRGFSHFVCQMKPKIW